MRRVLLGAAFLTGCAGGEPDVPADGQCDGDGDRQVLLVSVLSFAREEPLGTSVGFDLDGQVSTASDATGCYVEDLVGPDGEAGIDNSMAALLPVPDTTEAVVLEALVQESIHNGSLLLMVELGDVDGELDDRCVDVSVFKGQGAPMIGNDGWILPNQTLSLDPESPVNEAPSASLVDGVLESGPVDLISLPILVLDLDTTLEIFGAQIRLERHDDGSWTGLLGGGVEAQALSDVAQLANVDPGIAELIDPLLGIIADLERDDAGVCQQLSVVLELELVPAFVY